MRILSSFTDSSLLGNSENVNTKTFLREIARRTNIVDPVDGQDPLETLNTVFPTFDAQVEKLSVDPRFIWAQNFVENENPASDLKQVTGINFKSQVDLLKADYDLVYAFGRRIATPARSDRGPTIEERLVPGILISIGILLNARSERVIGMQKYFFLLFKGYGVTYPCMNAMSRLGLTASNSRMNTLLNTRAEKVTFR